MSSYPDALIGAKIDNYTVTRHLARGGMADVYLARNVRLQRDVVLKVLLPSFVENEAFVERFRREAQAMARLQHSGIVQVYDTGDLPDGRPFIAMQYVSGGTLEELLEKLDGQKQMMNLPFTLAIARQVAAALQVAHAAGIIHRDLKPSNILLDEQRRPILTDLGIAYVQDTQRLTRTDTFIGTPHYMSPEQAKGLPLDARSDIYSLGIILFEMLTAQRPFPGDSHWALIHAHVSTPAPAPSRLRPGLPRSIDRLVGRCLEKDPARRFQSAAELAAALDRTLTELGAGGSLTTSGEWRWQPRQSLELFINREGRVKAPAATGRNTKWLLGGLGGLALLLFGVFMIARPGPRPPATPVVMAVTSDTPLATAAANIPTASLPTDTPPTSTSAPIVVAAATSEPEANTATPTPEPPTAKPPANTPAPAVPGVVRARVLRDVFTRSGPGVTYPSQGGLGRDQIVDVLGRDGGGNWFLVQPPTGAPTWVGASYLEASVGSLNDINPAATIPSLPRPPATAPATAPTAPPAAAPPTAAPPTNTPEPPPDDPTPTEIVVPTIPG